MIHHISPNLSFRTCLIWLWWRLGPKIPMRVGSAEFAILHGFLRASHCCWLARFTIDLACFSLLFFAFCRYGLVLCLCCMVFGLLLCFWLPCYLWRFYSLLQMKACFPSCFLASLLYEASTLPRSHGFLHVSHAVYIGPLFPACLRGFCAWLACCPCCSILLYTGTQEHSACSHATCNFPWHIYMVFCVMRTYGFLFVWHRFRAQVCLTCFLPAMRCFLLT